MSAPTVVATRTVVTGTHELTVSTVRVAADYYDTAVFDESADRCHRGWAIGGFVIDKSSTRSRDRETAMEVHREALIALREETPRRPAGGAA